MKRTELTRLTLTKVAASGSFAGSADYILTSFGLTATEEIKAIHLGASPMERVTIVVDLGEPLDHGPGFRYEGVFRLVRLEDGKECLLDEGEATKASVDEKFGTINFSGKGKVLPSYQFACKSSPFTTRKIYIGGKTAEQLIAEMVKQGICVGGDAFTIMTRKAFKGPPKDHVFETTEVEREIEVAFVHCYDLGLVGEPYGVDIRKAAKKRGLELLPAEAGPHLRLQYMDQPSEEYLTVAMEPIQTYTPSFLHAPTCFMMRTPISDYGGSGMVPHPYFEGTHHNWPDVPGHMYAFLVP